MCFRLLQVLGKSLDKQGFPTAVIHSGKDQATREQAPTHGAGSLLRTAYLYLFYPPPTAYHPPPTTCRLPPTTYRLAPTTYECHLLPPR